MAGEPVKVMCVYTTYAQGKQFNIILHLNIYV